MRSARHGPMWWQTMWTRFFSSPRAPFVGAAKMINAIVSRKTSAVWDLVSWALNDEDAQVRKTVAKSCLASPNRMSAMGTMFAERAIADPDPDVRLSAIKTIEKLNRGHGRARDLILAVHARATFACAGRALACCLNSLTKRNCEPLSTTCSRPKRTPNSSRPDAVPLRCHA